MSRKKPKMSSQMALGVRPNGQRRRRSQTARTGSGWREGEIMIET
jgi:hypothetical protein